MPISCELLQEMSKIPVLFYKTSLMHLSQHASDAFILLQKKDAVKFDCLLVYDTRVLPFTYTQQKHLKIRFA